MKNEARKDISLFNFLTNERKFSNEWEIKKTKNKEVQSVLSHASKKDNRQRGEPDFIYVNEAKKILILIENKDSTDDHSSEKKDKTEKYGVDGILHYLKFFQKENLVKEDKHVLKYFKNWNFLGLAVSGDIYEEYNHQIDTFIVKDLGIKNLYNNNILNEREYLAYFQNIDIEEIITKVSKVSNEINQKLRNMNSQDRPVILSSLIICLFEKENFPNDFKNSFHSSTPSTIINSIPHTIGLILEGEGIPEEKIIILKDQFNAAIINDLDIANTNVLKDILIKLDKEIIPLFDTKTNYDIIGKFYEEFLKYAGVTNVKNGIVLTPRHITELFAELIDIKPNDVIFDPACGTGAFLISGMNKIIDLIDKSSMKNKQELKNKVKEKQLLGFEKNRTMFALSISNMLFRGDGKSQIYQTDFFQKENDEIIQEKQPTIGFINPPYGGLDEKKKNPTKKEIQFLVKLLDSCSRYVIMIAPLSTYFKEEKIRNAILDKHTLKYVINMPSELFQPNASTHTAVAVFETNLPHDNKEVLLYDLKDDGFVLSKQKGRTDVLNKWDLIKKDLFNKLNNPNNFTDDFNFVKTKIQKNDEWIIQAHSKTNYSELNEQNFIDSLREYVIFKTKKELNLLDKKDLNELELLEILNNSKAEAKRYLDTKT